MDDPLSGSSRTAEGWAANVQFLTRDDQKEKAPDWYMALFADKAGRAKHSKLIVLASPIGSVVLGRRWTGRWVLTPWPEDLDRAHFAKALSNFRDLAAYAESLDLVLSRLCRKVAVADVRRVRTRLRDAPLGQGSWLRLRSFFRGNLDRSLDAAMEGYAGADRELILPWLWPEATRATRLRALRALEPASIRMALHLNAGQAEWLPAGEAGWKLLSAIDAQEPLRRLACEMLSLSSAQVRWVNHVAGDPCTPSSLLPGICAILAHLPPEVRPQSNADLLAKRPLIKLAWEHGEALFSPELEVRLPGPEEKRRHRQAFYRSCVPLFKRSAPVPGETPKSRSMIVEWLTGLSDIVFVSAHSCLCGMRFAKREQLFVDLAEVASCPAQSLPLFIDEIEHRAQDVWKLPIGGDGRQTAVGNFNTPQHWAAANINGANDIVLSWPTCLEEMKALGRSLSNCLAGPEGRAYWLDIVMGQQLFVAISNKPGVDNVTSMAAMSIFVDPGNTLKVTIEQHFGKRNAAPPGDHIPFVRHLRAQIESELRSSVPGLVTSQAVLWTHAERLASDVNGWRTNLTVS